MKTFEEAYKEISDISKLEKNSNQFVQGLRLTYRLLRNLRELSESIDANYASVKDALSRSGKGTPDQAVVTTAAKYNEALKKLARE